jgi:hypothetical protein
MELKDRVDHGDVILASFDWNPHNLFHGPHQSIRENDPHYKKNVPVDFNYHDTEFLSSQSAQYQKSYQTYVGNKSIPSFTGLTENSATLPMVKNEKGKFYLPVNENT